MMMTLSADGLALIKHFEVFVPHVYDDQDKSWPRRRLTDWSQLRGVATWGYGTLYPSGAPLPADITEPDAAAKLRAKLPDYIAAVVRACKRTPTQDQFDALTSFAYNEGQGAVVTCGITAAFNRGETEPAAYKPLFLEWNKWRVNGQLVESAGLTIRRTKEWALFTRGMTAAPPLDIEAILAMQFDLVATTLDDRLNEVIDEAKS